MGLPIGDEKVSSLLLLGSGKGQEQLVRSGRFLTLATHNKELKIYQVKQIRRALEE